MDTITKGFFAFTMDSYARYYNKIMKSKKEELFQSLDEHLKHVNGDILEIGAGTGANFQLYPNGCSVVALDPNEHMNSYLCRSKEFYPNVNLKHYIVGSAEDMNKIEDQSVSVVVATLVLCSVDSVELALKEIIRVLKPGGRFYFLEHVKGKGYWMSCLQNIMNPIWFYVADGCHVARNTESLIRKADFKNVECQCFDTKVHPPFLRPHIMGFAEM